MINNTNNQTNNQINNIVKTALKWYDQNQEKYYHIMEKIKYIKHNQKEGLDHDTIEFYDKNKNKLFESRIEVLGLYFSKNKLWIWGWAVSVKKINSIISRKILNYALDIDTNYVDYLVKHQLVTSRFNIDTPMQIDIFLSIALYVSKTQLCFKYNIPEFDNPKNITKSELVHLQPDSAIHVYLYLLDPPQN